jgi:hypothetical protein
MSRICNDHSAPVNELDPRRRHRAVSTFQTRLPCVERTPHTPDPADIIPLSSKQ